MLSISYNWLLSQHGCHVGKRLASLFPCHSIQQGPRPGWVRATNKFQDNGPTVHIHHKNEVAFYSKKLPLRNRTSTINDAEAKFHCHTGHEQKKEWDKQSRSFQRSWKKTYPLLRFIQRNLYELEQWHSCWEISKSELSFCHKQKISVWTQLGVMKVLNP